MPRIIFLFLLLTPLLALAEPAQEWVQTYDGGGNWTDTGTFALADAAGNLVVGGISYDRNSAADFLVRKLARADGVEIWSVRHAAWDGTSDMALTGMAWDGAGDLLIGGHICGCGTG